MLELFEPKEEVEANKRDALARSIYVACVHKLITVKDEREFRMIAKQCLLAAKCFDAVYESELTE